MIKTIGNKIPTTVYHSLPRARIANGPLLVFIPGNPGVISYYIPYFQYLANQFPDLEILGISHAGHSTTVSQRFDKVFGLQDQIDHKINIIGDFLGDDATIRDVLIMGHSVGSWMMERIVSKLNDRLNFKFIGFLTPTVIDINKSEKGRVFAPIVGVLPIFNILVAKFSTILGLLPNRIFNFILSQILKNPPTHAFESTKAFISNSEHIRQSLGLATEEMHVIQDDWTYFEQFIKETSKIPTWYFFSNVDHWVNNETQSEITKKLEGLENVKIDTSDVLLHSFCLKQSKEFAEITINVLNELYYKH